MKPGDKVTVFYAKYLSHEDQLRLRELKHRVTVEELDIFCGKIMGFYSVEFPGYLFTSNEVEDDFILEVVN